MKRLNPNVLVCFILFVLSSKSQESHSANKASNVNAQFVSFLHLNPEHAPICLHSSRPVLALAEKRMVSHASRTNIQGGDAESNSISNTQTNVEERKDELLMIVAINASVSLLIFLVLFYLLQQKRTKKPETEESENPKQMPPESDSLYVEMVELSKTDRVRFLLRFQEVYSDFMSNFTKKHPNLTTTELTLCAMIFLGFTSKEIAQYTFIAHTSVQKRKNRLRKKLKVDPYTNLYLYIKSYK